MSNCDQLRKAWGSKKFDVWLRRNPSDTEKALNQRCHQILEDLKATKLKKKLIKKKIVDISSEIDRLIHDHPIMGLEEQETLEEWANLLNKVAKKRKRKKSVKVT